MAVAIALPLREQLRVFPKATLILERTFKDNASLGVLPARVSWDVSSLHRTPSEDVKLHRTYLVTSPIIAYYYTQLVGDAKTPPTLLASGSFEGIAVIGTSHGKPCFQSLLTRYRCGPIYPQRWRQTVVWEHQQLVSSSGLQSGDRLNDTTLS